MHLTSLCCSSPLSWNQNASGHSLQVQRGAFRTINPHHQTENKYKSNRKARKIQAMAELGEFFKEILKYLGVSGSQISTRVQFFLSIHIRKTNNKSENQKTWIVLNSVLKSDHYRYTHPSAATGLCLPVTVCMCLPQIKTTYSLKANTIWVCL